LGGLIYLHKVKHQLHRDIKPANILINSDGIVKLTDFGIAKTLENTEDLSNTFVGTKNYMSPERILGQDYSYSSDIWSLGLVVYELATGLFPYNFSKVYIEHVDSILKDPEPTLPNNGVYSAELQNFLTRCLKKNPLERDSAAELSAHPWILKYSDEDANVALWLAELYGNMIVD
jgi:serine/threonine protein kinase